MTDEQRFGEEEIAEIFERATTSEAASPHALAKTGLTLTELQEIGAEAGIPPERIADAAGVVVRRKAVVPAGPIVGVPRSVARTVHIDRALTDDEWERLVVDLRETFGAKGRLDGYGKLRTWSNGNLQVHVEPDGDRYRVRMRTTKGNVTPLTFAGAGFLLMALIMSVQMLAGGFESAVAVTSGLFAAMGLGTIGYVRAVLPAWASERAAQMQALAERIPLLLEEGSGT